MSVIAAVEGPSSLGDLASASMVGLLTGASGHAEVIHGMVLQALMPVILMATGKADVPPRCVVILGHLQLVHGFYSSLFWFGGFDWACGHPITRLGVG